MKKAKLKISSIDGFIEIDRWNHLANLIRLYTSFHEGISCHYYKSGVQYVDVPEIVGITGACENVDTLFRIGNRLSLPLFFTQTGQLSLEQALQKFLTVWTVIQSGRDEKTEDNRHLRQFKLTEEEFSWSVEEGKKKYDADVMFNHLLIHIQTAVKAAVAQTVKSHKTLLTKTYRRNLTHLENALKKDFLRITYDGAIKLLKTNGYPKISFGDDLKAEHEQKIVTILTVNKTGTPLPVFITHYPKAIKFFNMKVSEKDPRVVHSADLILPIAGEAVGSAVRENDADKLRKRLLTSNMFRLHKKRGGKYKDFIWYVEDIIAAGKTQPHAGFGLGNERLMQYILGTKDIRLASVLSLMSKESKGWER